MVDVNTHISTQFKSSFTYNMNLQISEKGKKNIYI